ncbi:membrane protein [Sulfurivirga caldicuralii]|uniref:Membrane protein n=1 Tax=Sulfurivirga caldicuralii TaxID=364032 RepID=A0A1N6GB03_9GAMM|nr:YihY family inner membrane protein [Sulfurivirga caldicuralii]SIO04698.1 membrane protein [Sulfurivirga caldicuralii]
MPSSDTNTNLWPIVFQGAFWRSVWARFVQAGGLDSAAALAYTTLLGLVPLIALVLSVLSVSHWFDAWRDEIVHAFVRMLSPEALDRVEAALVSFSRQAAALKGPSLLFLAVTVVFLLDAVYKKVAAIWLEAERSRWWVRVLHYLGVSLLGPILLVASLAISSWLLALPWLTDSDLISQARYQLLKGVPTLLTVVGFYLFYRYAPPVPVKPRAALLGALLATLLLGLLKFGFSLYAQWVPTYKVIYGALAAVPLLLVWLYLLWVLVLFSAAVVWGLDRVLLGKSLKTGYNEMDRQNGGVKR